MYNTRYWFLKKIYPNHLLLFSITKNKLGYRCFGVDKYIFDNIREYSTDITVILNKLNEVKINYVLVDNLTIKMVKNYETNMYNNYLYKFISLSLLDRIRAGVFR